MTCLVLVPGLLCDEALWAPQVAALQGEADIRVADVTAADSLGAIAAGVLALTDGPFALAGLSMGGYVAFEVLRRAPERVQRVALLATSARPDDPAKRAERLAVIALAQAGDFAAALERLVPSWMGADAPSDPALLAALEAMALRVGPEAFLRQERALLARADSRPTLASITCPALVLCGRQDLRTPVPRSAEIAAGIAGARLVLVEDCGCPTPIAGRRRCSTSAAPTTRSSRRSAPASCWTAATSRPRSGCSRPGAVTWPTRGPACGARSARAWR